ncbi:amidase [Arenibaculum pallidiluteum]|uniref:amidase n=1 Tax=Arenibaculum pallidiluteum TaxID=2812559 RepID=UPI001A95A6B1|nr:amidase [Arenibaculum pallidiluteum]
MTEALHFQPLTTIAERIRRRELSPVDVAAAALDRIAVLDARVRAYKLVLAERAMDQARRAEAEIARGIWRGPLHGVPVAVKDLCYTDYAPTACGTRMLEGWVPDHSATVVERLEMAGAVMLGKLRMTEGAYTSHHPEEPAPLNPWSTEHWVGSSSSGSGVAPAAGLCYGAIGTDTGGSIRFPSANCGLTGIKPTWGRVSRHGVFPLAASLDHVGPMCRSAADAAAMLGAIAGPDPRDPTSLPAAVPDYMAEIGRNIRGLRLGIDRRYLEESTEAEVTQAVLAAEAVLRSLGARVVEVDFPDVDALVKGWIPLCAIETAAAHREHYPARAAQYGPDLARLIEQGRAATSAEIAAAFHERIAFAGRLATLFESVDVLLMPTLPFPIPSLAKLSEFGQDDRVLNRLIRSTAPFNLSGSPTVTLPCGIDGGGLPLSLQLVGPHLSEATLCRAAHAYQQATDWHTRRPAGLA